MQFGGSRGVRGGGLGTPKGPRGQRVTLKMLWVCARVCVCKCVCVCVCECERGEECHSRWLEIYMKHCCL